MYKVITLATNQFLDNLNTPIATPSIVAVTQPMNANTSVLIKPIRPARR